MYQSRTRDVIFCTMVAKIHVNIRTKYAVIYLNFAKILDFLDLKSALIDMCGHDKIFNGIILASKLIMIN